ncbi:MAG TPA: efflux RND transporter periplasmic adaptor subunit [Alphaproteobacteria bacterium]|nr:efflux RND transporter periplasmic adaptor subunit [Alphaproteobacteria bacterium]
MKRITRVGLAALLSISVTFPALAQKGGRGPSGPVPVFVAPVVQTDFADHVEALGTTKSNEMVVITADTAEKVTAIHFEEGQEVKKGDLLITLAKGEEDADLKAAQAQLAEAQSSYDRAKELQNTNALSKATLEERLATLRQRRAAIASITARLDKRAITAPFDGVLGLREVSIGTLVKPGDTITTIDDISVIKVDFDVPSVFLPTLKSGLKVIGKVEAFGEREFIGHVQTVNTQVDPVTRTIKVRAIIPNEDRVLKPGLLMTINLLKNERRALVIPEEALLKKGNQNLVYVADNSDGKTVAKQKEIKIGTRNPGEIEVLSGLSAGDQVVVHGTLKISDGSEIAVKAVEKNNETLADMLKQQPVKSPDKTDGEK